MADAEHWDDIYSTKPSESVSWYQEHSTVSLDLINRAGLGSRGRFVDVGAGASRLVDELLSLGLASAVLVDISQSALAVTRQRLGGIAPVEYIAGDVLELDSGPVDLWHDRALFHFLGDPTERKAYVEVASRHVVAGGHAVVAAFAEDGPEYCSGLPTQRYSDAELAAQFAPSFSLVTSRREVHVTPDGREQSFIYVLLQKADNRD
jgi:ubiquinone/menaquinone biosynthesis C-methylase UbiE